ncbi:hypothetical protein, partial [Vibrio parahaemolyticus]
DLGRSDGVLRGDIDWESISRSSFYSVIGILWRLCRGIGCVFVVLFHAEWWERISSSSFFRVSDI